jgi:hypothetical protein
MNLIGVMGLRSRIRVMGFVCVSTVENIGFERTIIISEIVDGA